LTVIEIAQPRNLTGQVFTALKRGHTTNLASRTSGKQNGVRTYDCERENDGENALQHEEPLWSEVNELLAD
jgi:hypothetical protein